MFDLPYHTPLTPAQLATAGIGPDWPFGVADKVHFHELDVLNHVNNVAYFRWFESLRVAYLRAYGLSDFGPTAPRLVLRNATCHYIKEMLLGQSYVLTGRTSSYRSSSFTMDHAIFVDGEMMATGQTVIVNLARDGSGKAPLSAAQIALFQSRDGATQA